VLVFSLTATIVVDSPGRKVRCRINTDLECLKWNAEWRNADQDAQDFTGDREEWLRTPGKKWWSLSKRPSSALPLNSTGYDRGFVIAPVGPLACQ
jgi:hypothetical protein